MAATAQLGSPLRRHDKVTRGRAVQCRGRERYCPLRLGGLVESEADLDCDLEVAEPLFSM